MEGVPTQNGVPLQDPAWQVTLRAPGNVLAGARVATGTMATLLPAYFLTTSHFSSLELHLLEKSAHAQEQPPPSAGSFPICHSPGNSELLMPARTGLHQKRLFGWKKTSNFVKRALIGCRPTPVLSVFVCVFPLQFLPLSCLIFPFWGGGGGVGVEIWL